MVPNILLYLNLVVSFIILVYIVYRKDSVVLSRKELIHELHKMDNFSDSDDEYYVLIEKLEQREDEIISLNKKISEYEMDLEDKEENIKAINNKLKQKNIEISNLLTPYKIT